MKRLFLAVLALCANLTTPAFAANETCSALTKEDNALIQNAAKGMSAYREGEKIFIPFCAEFEINSDCQDILDLLGKKLSQTDFAAKVDPMKRSAYSAGSMNGKEAMAFSGLVDTMYNGFMTNIYSLRKTGPTEKQMAAKKCSEVAKLIALSDTALISASKQNKTGVCTVASVKGGKFKILVKGETYPLDGVTYPSMTELAKGLKEVLDSAQCF